MERVVAKHARADFERKIDVTYIELQLWPIGIRRSARETKRGEREEPFSSGTAESGD
jgi:hypothetical protein